MKVVGALFDLVGSSALFYGLSRVFYRLFWQWLFIALGGVAMLFEIATATAGGQSDPIGDH